MTQCGIDFYYKLSTAELDFIQLYAKGRCLNCVCIEKWAFPLWGFTGIRYSSLLLLLRLLLLNLERAAADNSMMMEQIRLTCASCSLQRLFDEKENKFERENKKSCFYVRRR